MIEDPEIRVLYLVADRLGKSVREILELSIWEFHGWVEFLAWEGRETEKRTKGAGHGGSKSSRRLHSGR